jgi:hypothetical protein
MTTQNYPSTEALRADNIRKLKAALKRKTAIREGLGGTQVYKIQSVDITFIDGEKYDDKWYHFKIDGYEFDCRWYDNAEKTKFYFRNNARLEDGGYTYKYGVFYSRVAYASSAYFGYGDTIISILWVLGEVLAKKSTYDYFYREVKK